MRRERIEALTRTCGFLCVLAALQWIGAPAARASQPHAEPGEWEMTSTAHNPMLPAPQTVMRKECLARGDLDPDTFMRDAEGCTITESSTSSNAMSWTMVCEAEGGQMTGKGQLETSASGKRVEGSMKLSANFGGQAMNFSQEWSGRWVGPCP